MNGMQAAIRGHRKGPGHGGRLGSAVGALALILAGIGAAAAQGGSGLGGEPKRLAPSGSTGVTQSPGSGLSSEPPGTGIAGSNPASTGSTGTQGTSGGNIESGGGSGMRGPTGSGAPGSGPGGSPQKPGQ